MRAMAAEKTAKALTCGEKSHFNMNANGWWNGSISCCRACARSFHRDIVSAGAAAHVRRVRVSKGKRHDEDMRKQ